MGNRDPKNRSHCSLRACSTSTLTPALDVPPRCVPSCVLLGRPRMSKVQAVSIPKAARPPRSCRYWSRALPSGTSNHEATSTSAQKETLGFGGSVQWLDSHQGRVKGVGSLLGRTSACAGPLWGLACRPPDRPLRAGLRRRWLSRIPEPQAGACLPDSRLVFTAWKKQKEPFLSSGHILVAAHPHTAACHVSKQ